jgi:hypothetical protein
MDEVVCPPGDQRYVPPNTDGIAVKVAELPLQMDWLFTVTTAVGLTVTILETELLEQPFNV